MTLAQRQFLELLRAGLWGEPANTDLFHGDVDWKAILRIAKEQTVRVIVAEGIETLPQEMWPPSEATLHLMMMRVKTLQMHHVLNSTLNQIVNALNAEGIHSVLLKGQGAAQNYRKPESRMCGDIDLYIGLDNYKRACEIVENLNTEDPKRGVECEHHMHIGLNGVEIEIHRYADMMPNKRHNSKFQKWTKENLDTRFGTDTLRTWDNDGTDISLADPTYDAFIILHHAVRHMTTEGVGLRQICDWTMFLHKNHQHINTKELNKRLKEFNMDAIWQEFGLIAINCLGLPAEELPLAPSSLTSQKTERLLYHIFQSGNFGRYSTEPKVNTESLPYLIKKWHHFLIQSRRHFKLFDLFPKYVAQYIWQWLTGAFVRLMQGV